MNIRLTQMVLRNQRELFIMDFSLLIFNLFQDYVSTAKALVHVVGASLGGFGIGLGVGEQRHDMGKEFVVIAVTPSAAAGNDVAGLLELVVVGAEEDGLAEGHRLENVMDAYAEATAYISHVGVAIELGEEADVVDDENFR